MEILLILIKQFLSHCTPDCEICNFRHNDVHYVLRLFKFSNILLFNRYTFKESCLGTVEHGFFGVFDGYNNAVAADKCSKHFYDIMIKEIGKTNNDFDYHQMSEDQIEKRIELVKEALKACFHEMDSYLLIGEFESSKLRWSGTSATICYIESDTLFIANAGSVRGLFVKSDGSAVSITQGHTLENKKERDRLRKSNASLSLSTRSSLVNGLLASTRGLGNHGDPVLKSLVISSPNVTALRIDPDDQFLILYSAGIWEIFSDNEVMFLLEDIMPDFSDVDVLREHLLKQELGNRPKGQNDQMPKIDEISVDQVRSERDNQDILTKKESKSKHQADFVSSIIGQNGNLVEGENAVEIEVDQTFEESPAESNISSEPLSTDIPLASPNRGEQSYKESKSCFLARALVERLVYSALLAGSHENITAMVVLLHGCPINLYLLPEVKRKSVVQRIISKIE